VHKAHYHIFEAHPSSMFLKPPPCGLLASSMCCTAVAPSYWSLHVYFLSCLLATSLLFAVRLAPRTWLRKWATLPGLRARARLTRNSEPTRAHRVLFRMLLVCDLSSPRQDGPWRAYYYIFEARSPQPLRAFSLGEAFLRALWASCQWCLDMVSGLHPLTAP
jgi:hypothetical protein